MVFFVVVVTALLLAPCTATTVLFGASSSAPMKACFAFALLESLCPSVTSFVRVFEGVVSLAVAFFSP
jgi:hypothetical protein